MNNQTAFPPTRFTFPLLNLTGWILFLLVTATLSLSQLAPSQRTVYLLIQWPWPGLFISFGLHGWYRWWRHRERSVLALAAGGMAASLAGSLIWTGFDLLLLRIFFPELVSPDRILAGLPALLNTYALPLLCWSFLYFSLSRWRDWQEQARSSERADRLARQAQLQMLRSQLNPHFLFNSLNSIRALIDEDEEKASRMISELTGFLRYSMQGEEFSGVPLKNELAAIEYYFAIQQKRYEEKLVVRFDISPAARDFPVLSFLLHPVVENAIKYGMQTSPMPLRVHIGASVEGDNLKLTVSNSGRWVTPSSSGGESGTGTGTGLLNVRQRLANAYPGFHRMSTFESDGMVHIQLEITRMAGENHE